MKEMTARQREVLNFIRGFMERHGAPPTVREIGDTVREHCPPPVDPRVSDRWLPVRGAGAPPSVGNRS